MNSLRKRLCEMALIEAEVIIDGLIVKAGELAPPSVTGSDLLRIASGGKTQVLRNKVIKQLADAMETKLLGQLADEVDK